jgi:flagellar assembly protein FliH
MLIKKKNLSHKFLTTEHESQTATASQDFNYQEINFKPVESFVTSKNKALAISPDEEEKIQLLINVRKQELLEKLENEINQKKQNALAEIQSMIDSANNQAQEIINEANQQAQELEEDLNSQKSIFERDKIDFLNQIEIEKKEAFNQAMEEARVYFDEFSRYISEFQNMEKTALLEALPQITSIALDVARQILQYEANSNPKLLEQQVLRSIEKVINSKGVIQIYLNPSEIESASKLEKALIRLLDQNTRVVFLEDPNVDLGSCLINTQGGRLNASFRAQLEVIKSSFEKYLGHPIDDSILDIPEPVIDSVPEDILEPVIEPDSKPLKAKKTKEKKPTTKTKKNKISPVLEPSDEDLELIENEDLDLDFEDDLASLLDDLMVGIENEALDPIQDKSKNLSKNQNLGFNNRNKDLLMEDQMAKFLDDEFEDNEELEDEEDTFEFEDELDEEDEEEDDDLDDLEEFGEDDFADEEEEEDEDDPRYPEY